MYKNVPSQDNDNLLARTDKQSLSVSERYLSGDKTALPEGTNCCTGLNHADPQIRQASRLKFCLSCFIFLAILLPIIFLVIIPEVTQHMVDESDLHIIEANIINPNDVSFTSHVTQKFQNIDEDSVSNDAEIQMHKLSLLWNDGTGNKKLATLTHSNAIGVSTSKVTMKSQANVKDVDALSEFNLFAISANKFQWEIHGTATVETLGLRIPVDVKKTVDMIGFNNFPIPPVINQINITNGSPTVITNQIQATFTNDANIALTFGQDVEFTLTSNDIQIGTGVIPNLDLQTGTFPVSATVYLSATEGTTQYNQLMAVISNFTTGYPSPVIMGPFRATSTIQWLEAGLASMRLSSAIPGLTQELIDSVDMYPIDGSVVIPFTMYMTNPIDTTYKLTHITAQISSNGTLISSVDADVEISIPARETILSPVMNAIANYMDPVALEEIGKLETAGTGLLSVRSTLTGFINEFPTVSSYAQDNVPATLHHA
jgi:hypothetical protein